MILSAKAHGRSSKTRLRFAIAAVFVGFGGAVWGQSPVVERPLNATPPMAPDVSKADAGKRDTMGSDGLPIVGTTPAGQATVDQPVSAQQTARTIPAGPAITSWDTFMYEGPGLHYRSFDEVRQGQALTVLSCADGWCQVSFDGGRPGYILAEVVVTGNPAMAAPGYLPQPAEDLIPNPPGPCIETMQTEGNGGTKPTRFCQKQSQ